MAGPNLEEKELIDLLRTRVADLHLHDDSDMFLVRWIRARDLNLYKAEEMLRKHIQWMDENDYFNVMRTWEPPADFEKNFPVEIIGYDVDNSPIAVLAYGKWDIKKCYESGQKDDYLKYLGKTLYSAMEFMEGKFRADGVPVTQFVLVLDMDHLSMKFLTSFGAMDLTMETLRLFEANHPETLKKCYVVNASKVFTILFAIVKPLLSQHTFGKVEIYDHNVCKFSPKMQKLIPAEILPAKLGGKNYTSVLNGPQHLKKAVHDDFKKVMVAAGGNHVVQFTVTDSNSVLSWSFLTSNHDIGFSLSCESEELVKYARVEAKLKPQEGSVICNKPGTYKLLFDNSYSHFRSKEIKFTTSLGCK